MITLIAEIMLFTVVSLAFAGGVAWITYKALEHWWR